jgi:hypothetical protein
MIRLSRRLSEVAVTELAELASMESRLRGGALFLATRMRAQGKASPPGVHVIEAKDI